MKNGKMKDFGSFLLRIFLSAGVLWFVFSKIDTKEAYQLIRQADFIYLIYAGIGFLIINILLFVRWMIYIRALDLKVRMWDAARFYNAGLFGNLFLPSSMGGDIFKIVGLCKGSSEKPKVVASVLLDRLSGFVAIVIVAIVAFVLGYRTINNNFLLLPVVVIFAGSIVAGGILFNERVYEFCCRMFNALPKFKTKLMQMHYDISLLRRRKGHAAWAVLISCFNQIIFCVNFYLFAKALHQDIHILYFLLFGPFICVLSSIPSIGGLGVREAGSAYLFSRIGVAAEIGVSSTLFIFLFMVLFGIFGGAWYVFTVPDRRIQSDSSDVVAG